MSKIIASAAIRGGHACVRRAETALAESLDRYGRDKDIGFPSTAYALPVILALTGKRVERLGDLEEALGTARSWLPAEPTERLWLPLLDSKFDGHYDDLPATYMWARTRRMSGTREGVEELAVCGSMVHMCVDAFLRAATARDYRCELLEDELIVGQVGVERIDHVIAIRPRIRVTVVCLPVRVARPAHRVRIARGIQPGKPERNQRRGGRAVRRPDRARPPRSARRPRCRRTRKTGSGESS